MKLDWLTDPITPDDPCGPDLEQAGDEAFLDYYYEAESRLPERYFTPGVQGVGSEGSDDALFDPRSINIRREQDAIEALLHRSRDLRLLSLMARFHILAGRLSDFADSIQGIATLLETWPVEVNPVAEQSLADRRGALDELGTQTTVIQPLLHLSLTGAGEASLRRHMAATGAVPRRYSEEDADAGAILSALRSPVNTALVDKTNADVGRAIDGLARIVGATAAHPTHPFKPNVEDTMRVLGELQALILQGRPDLTHRQVEVAATAPATANSPTSAPDTAPASHIATRSEAKSELVAVETWLSEREPSSPALLLVTQARLLIGRPLVEALETLMPGDAARAVIGFSPDTGFAMPMDRLRALSQAALGPGTDNTADAPPAKPVTTRQDLSARLVGIEDHFRSHEPASPIPILLARARAFLDKGFEAIVGELIPRTPPAG